MLFDTAQRFKGLESDIVVLWLNGRVSSEELDALCYVGCSRAKTVLVLLGNRQDVVEIF